MLRESTPLVRFAVNITMALILVLGFGQLSGYFYDADKSDFIKLVEYPRTYSSETLQPSRNFHPGEGLLIENKAIKYEIGCWAEYQYTFTGPATFSYNSGKSRELKPRGTSHVFKLKNFIQLPENIPYGPYKIQMIVYPTCDGVPRDPFNAYGAFQPWIQIYPEHKPHT